MRLSRTFAAALLAAAATSTAGAVSMQGGPPDTNTNANSASSSSSAGAVSTQDGAPDTNTNGNSASSSSSAGAVSIQVNTSCDNAVMAITDENGNMSLSISSASDQCSEENLIQNGNDEVDIHIGVEVGGELTIGSLDYDYSSTTTLSFQPGNVTIPINTLDVDNLPGSFDLTFENESEGLSGLTKLSSLTVLGAQFTSPDVVLSLPDSISYIKLGGTNATNLSLQVNNISNLTSIDLESNEFTTLPKVFYERNYSQNININISSFESIVGNMDTLELDDTLYWTLSSNLEYINVSEVGNLSELLGLNPSCNSTDDSVKVCIKGTSSSSGSSSYSGSGSGSNVVNVGDSNGDGNTTLIVVVVVVVVVILVLGIFILRMYFKRRAASSGTRDETAVNLMDKGDTAGEKGSFISSDEFLRDFRLPQSEVSLVKSIGSGRLWVGEYNGGKVVVKRVEAEVTDSFVTKALMSQARTFARLSHPSITSLVGVTWLAGTDFAVVTEFMDKGNLKTVLANKDIKLDLDTKLQMCLDVALALAYLHASEQNLCVKHLSSRKVLVNSALTCKLNLFECVPSSPKLGGPSSESTFSYGMGEVAWLAPEVITRSAPMDPRKSNIFAFGVLVCEILTRASPYETLAEEKGNTLSDVELVRRVRDHELLAPHENRREYLEAPLSLRKAVDQCLSHVPMNRPSAKDLLSSLQSAKDELPTSTPTSTSSI